MRRTRPSKLAGAGPSLRDPSSSSHTPARLVPLPAFHRGRHGPSESLHSQPRSPRVSLQIPSPTLWPRPQRRICLHRAPELSGFGAVGRRGEGEREAGGERGACGRRRAVGRAAPGGIPRSWGWPPRWWHSCVCLCVSVLPARRLCGCLHLCLFVRPAAGPTSTGSIPARPSRPGETWMACVHPVTWGESPP